MGLTGLATKHDKGRAIVSDNAKVARKDAAGKSSRLENYCGADKPIAFSPLSRTANHGSRLRRGGPPSIAWSFVSRVSLRGVAWKHKVKLHFLCYSHFYRFRENLIHSHREQQANSAAQSCDSESLLCGLEYVQVASHAANTDIMDVPSQVSAG